MGHKPDESVWWIEDGEIKHHIWDEYILFAAVRDFVEPIVPAAQHQEVFNMDFKKSWLKFTPDYGLGGRAICNYINVEDVPEPILLAMTIMGIDYV